MEEKYIPGIYNYCDRWCERCGFTTRCRNFESTGTLSSDQLDANNKAFWDTIAGNLQKAMELMQKAAAEHGFDLSQGMTKEEEATFDEQQRLLKVTVKSHQLTKLNKQYQKLAMPFVNNSEGMVDKTRELINHLHMGITNEEDVVHTMAGLGDCFEIIQWYLFFIDAKLQRALGGKLEDDGWEEEKGFQKDSDGSAKIALIAIDRSMGAWQGLYNTMPACEDTALEALSVLSRLKQKALEEFPKAMEFKRPGFD
jgi:hypothetical protein